MRAAARRTNKAVSSGRWYQLESGVQKIKGQEIPVGTTPATVAAAAIAVDLDINEALTLAGFDPRDYTPPALDSPYVTIPTDDLLDELRRRIPTDEEKRGWGWSKPGTKWTKDSEDTEGVG